MDFVRRAYQAARTSDGDERPQVEEVDPEGRPLGKDMQITDQDLVSVMKQIQSDDTIPKEQKDLMKKLSQKMVNRPVRLDNPEDDFASSPTGSESPSMSPAGSERSGPRMEKTYAEIQQLTNMLQGIGIPGMGQGGQGSEGGSVSNRDYHHSKAIQNFANGGKGGVYMQVPNDNVGLGQTAELGDATPGTPTNYAGAKNPQDMKYHPSRTLLIGVSAVNFICGVIYMYWRYAKSLNGIMDQWFPWVFVLGETLVMISAWQSHCSRFFPVKRVKCTVDDLVKVDRGLGEKTVVTIFMPTAGETLMVLRVALLGNLSMRLWPSELEASQQLRINVLDEKRRPEVITLVALCYKFAAIFQNDAQIKVQLKRDRVPDITVRGFYKFYEQCAAQFGRRYHTIYTQAFDVAAMIDKLCLENKIPEAWDGIELPTGRRVEPTLSVENGRLPRLREDFDEVINIPSIVYFSRRNPGEPAISPKAGNMNSVLFPEDPVDEDVVNNPNFVVINDARHAFEPEYLQRCIPYFFELKRIDGVYKYQICKRIAFLQVPQRFRDRGDGDPFGNQSAVMFDVTNIGRDGVGGVMSCGQGSCWRVDVVRDGITAEGKKSVDPMEVRANIGKKVGFSQESRIEDTMTSIGLFAKGFRSVYINEENEFLGWCTQEPNSMEWRIKQLFRWHYGAVELFSMGPFKLQEGRFPTMWHRVYVWESCTYFFQAMSAQIFLLMPIWYCMTWQPPFTTHQTDFIWYLLPFFLTAVLPTTIGLGWRKVNPDLALREEQVWMATSYVQMYAFVSSVWARVKRATTALSKDSGASNWSVDCPVWPLYLTFFAEFAGIIVSSVRWFRNGFEQPWVWVSSMGGAMMAIWMLWPVVVKGLRLPPLSKFYMRYMALGAFIIIVAAWQK